jgi:hypothetical protein
MSLGLSRIIWKYRNCLHCSKEFYCKPVVAKNPNRGKYCSNACQHKLRISMGIKLPSVCFHHNKRAKPKHCKGCGVVVEGKGGVYCSDECRCRKSDFSKHREENKSNGVTQFKWHEPCMTCAKVDQVYYSSVYSKRCKTCHNKLVWSSRSANEERKKYHYEYTKQYRKENAVKLAKKHKIWARANRHKINKYKKNPKSKIINNIRKRLHKFLKEIGVNNKNHSMIVGCTKLNFINHIESKFTHKMTWQNYGSYWHVDHIIPISSFDLTDPKQCKQANHWTNLQPLEASKNIAKSNTITQPQMSLMLNL